MKVEAFVYECFTIIFIVTGTFTNVISAIVYSRKKMRTKSYSTYLFSLAIADLCTTIIGNIRLAMLHFNIGYFIDSHFLNEYGGIDIRELSLVSCRIHSFLTYFFLQFSSVMICLLNVDRVLGVVRTLQTNKFCKAKTAKFLVLVMVVFLSLVNSHFLINMGNFTDNIDNLEDGNSHLELHHLTVRFFWFLLNFFGDLIYFKLIKVIQKCCHKESDNSISFWDVFFYIDTIIYCILPFIIMATCNSLIIGKIVRSRIRSKQVIIRRVKNSMKTKMIENKPNTMLGTEKRLSITLISISISFFIFTFPVFLIENLERHKLVNTSETYWKVSKALTYMLMYLNHIINFFFYCLLGPGFRKEVIRLIPCRKKSEKNSVHPVKFSKQATFIGPNSPLSLQMEKQSIMLKKIETYSTDSFHLQFMFNCGNDQNSDRLEMVL